MLPFSIKFEKSNFGPTSGGKLPPKSQRNHLVNLPSPKTKQQNDSILSVYATVTSCKKIRKV